MRRTALLAATATLCICAAPSPASADLGGTLCSLGGWVSGVVGKVCNVARHAGGVISAGQKLAGGHVGGAIGALTGSGVAKAAARSVGFAAVAAAVVAGAQYALQQTGRLVGSTETPRLGATWFSAYYWRMAAVATLLTLPFLCAAAIQAMLRSDVSLLARSAFGYLPLGLLAVGIAAPLTGLLLAASDEMSAIVSAAAGHADTGILDRAGLVSLIAGGSRSLFVAFFIALFTVAGAVTLWLELLIRQAAVYVIVLMLPLFFAAMVWPARRIWAIRAVELLVALILSKFAIVAVLSLGERRSGTRSSRDSRRCSRAPRWCCSPPSHHGRCCGCCHCTSSPARRWAACAPSPGSRRWPPMTGRKRRPTPARRSRPSPLPGYWRGCRATGRAAPGMRLRRARRPRRRRRPRLPNRNRTHTRDERAQRERTQRVRTPAATHTPDPLRRALRMPGPTPRSWTRPGRTRSDQRCATARSRGCSGRGADGGRLTSAPRGCARGSRCWTRRRPRPMR